MYEPPPDVETTNVTSSQFHTEGGPTVVEWPVNLTVLVACQLKHFFYVKQQQLPWKYWRQRTKCSPPGSVRTCNIWLYRCRKCLECDTWWDALLLDGHPEDVDCRSLGIGGTCPPDGMATYTRIVIVDRILNSLEKCAASFRYWVIEVKKDNAFVQDTAVWAQVLAT
jgi:hypothetical protein